MKTPAYFAVAVALSTVLYSALPAFSVQHPCFFVNAEEILILKSKITQEPWKTAYNSVIREANAALSKGPFYLPLPYNHVWLGGSAQRDIEAKYNLGYDAHRHTAMRFGHYLINAAMAWNLTRETKYLDWCSKNINSWFFDPRTYMEPRLPGGTKVGINSSMFPVAYGVDLAWPGLSAEMQAKVKDWFTRMHNNELSSSEGGWTGTNNRNHWWQAAVLYTGLLADKPAIVPTVADGWKKWTTSPWQGEIIWNTGDKGAPVLSDPTRGGRPDYKYQDFSTAAAHVVLELCRHNGIDIYNHEIVNGRSKYERIMDGEVYVAGPCDTYHWETFEVANWYKPKATYDAIVKRIGRPINFAEWDHGVGPLTFTHYKGGVPFKVYKSGVTASSASRSSAQTFSLKSSGAQVLMRPVNAADNEHAFDIAGRILSHTARSIIIYRQ